MSYSAPRLFPRNKLVSLLLLLPLLTIFVLWQPFATLSSRTLAVQGQVQTFVRQINLPTGEIVFNSATQKIYASVPSRAGSIGNSITEIDPVAGTVGQSVFIGSEPNKMGLSGDGQVLYVGVDGAAAFRRYHIPTQTAGPQISLGFEPFSGS